MFSLRNRTAIITGAAGLIGKAIAQNMVKQGANVILLDVNEEALQNTEQEISKNFTQSQINTYTCDITKENAVDEVIKNICDKNGKIDILVNNAGITRDKLFSRMDLADFDLVMNVNLRAAFILSQKVLPSMVSNRFGRIINISSIVGFTGNIGQVNYCSSKAGLVGMTKSIAQEVARREITVNCIAPGFINSAMTETLSDSIKEKLIAKIPMMRMGDAVDVANAVCFLASEEASYITGQTIHVNGGMAMI